jgi:dihydrofolate synthase/folylpolyglutamate synthase
MAFYHFKEMKVHVAVLEVGLGGLFDSTNIARAKAVGIAPISLEHTDKLGKTIAKIAVQKAGVIKGREIVVSAQQSDEADAVIQRACDENEAKLFRVRKDLKIFERDYGEDFQRFDLKTPFGNFYDLKIKMPGRYQIDNAALAVGLAKSLELRTRLKISEAAVRRGLLDTHWPGRLEKVWPDPLIILDGAHNAESMRLSIQGLKRHFQYKKLVAVLGVSSDKDIAGMLEHLVPEAATLILTRSLNPRALPVKELKNYLEAFQGQIVETANADEALQAARVAASPGDAVLVTGSLFVVGEMKAALGREN